MDLYGTLEAWNSCRYWGCSGVSR